MQISLFEASTLEPQLWDQTSFPWRRWVPSRRTSIERGRWKSSDISLQTKTFEQKCAYPWQKRRALGIEYYAACHSKYLSRKDRRTPSLIMIEAMPLKESRNLRAPSTRRIPFYCWLADYELGNDNSKPVEPRGYLVYWKIYGGVSVTNFHSESRDWEHQDHHSL